MSSLNIHEFVPVEKRLSTLQNLIKDLPQERQERILESSHLTERLQNASPYLPTTGLEAETFEFQFPDSKLPYEKIAKVEAMGIIRDKNDSFPNKGKENKWEAALQPVEGSYLLLMRELSSLVRHGVVSLREKVFNKGKPIRTLKYFVPIHATFGKIARDFPPDLNRKDSFIINDEKIYMKDQRTTLKDWTQHEGTNLNGEGWKREYQHSDCFAFARMLDSTLYATSPERVVEPYDNYVDGEPLTSHAHKGFSGVKGRSGDEDGQGMDAVEVRTSELWGVDSISGLQRYMNSGEAIGAMLIAYQKMPMGVRDQIIGLEKAGKVDEARQIVEDFTEYTLPNDQKLALGWWDSRKQVCELFKEYDIPDPTTEYWDTEFQRFAKVLREQEKKMLNGDKDNFITKARMIAIEARAYVHDLVH